MTTRYVGEGGSDLNDGLSWANRKLTLNGVEDTPVTAGDDVYVGPGTYREVLIGDVSGSNGQPITYIGDVTGEHTDGIGGLVRITGLDADTDTTATRNNVISAGARDYRTFRGFYLDGAGTNLITALGGNCIIEDCFFTSMESNSIAVSYSADPHDLTVRRCVAIHHASDSSFYFIYGDDTTQRQNFNLLVENCIVYGSCRFGGGIRLNYKEGCVVKNNLFFGCYNALWMTNSSSDPVLAYNNIFMSSGSVACNAGASGDLTEDYNAFWQNEVDRNNVSTGSNSVVRHPMFMMPMLMDGFKFASKMWQLMDISDLIRRAGTSEATDDLFGITRPTTSSKKSWGPIQYRAIERETTTVYDSSTASLKIDDAGEQVFRVPVDGSQITISVRAYREANYAGTLPQMIIRQPGQSDRTTTDTGSSGAWNELSDTFTPSGTDFVDVILRSNNTATSGNYDVFFDSVVVA